MELNSNPKVQEKSNTFLCWEYKNILKMNTEICKKIITICNDKIDKKGENVGLSFYAFFANKNDQPELLMEVAQWWILTHKLDHFEKAIKIRVMIEREFLN